MSTIEFPLAFCTLLWVCACMAIMFEFRQCGPDILAQHSAWNVLLLSSVCLKIPSCISGGVRVIHALQPCPYCTLLNLSAFCALSLLWVGTVCACSFSCSIYLLCLIMIFVAFVKACPIMVGHESMILAADEQVSSCIHGGCMWAFYGVRCSFLAVYSTLVPTHL